MLRDYFKILKEEDLPYQTFLLLVSVYEDDMEFVKFMHDRNYMEQILSIELLERRGFVKQHGDNPEDIVLRKSGEDLFKSIGKKKKEKTDVHLWIDQWREIFPPGSNTGGYRYRGNKLEALKKMIKFADLYPFTREEIFKATTLYVKRFSLKGYAYMQLAHFFIEKQNVGSTLASECEGLRENPVENQESTYGRDII